MDDVLAGTLREAVCKRLDHLDHLAAAAGTRSLAMLAGSEIVRLTAAWRAVLSAHEPDERGRCPVCSGWRRPAPYPCTVWAVAHHHLIAVPRKRIVDGGGRHRSR